MVTNHTNEFWDKKCTEIQSYLGSKKSSESWKFIKNICLSSSGKSQLDLISVDTREKYYYKLLVEDRKEFLGKNERLLEKDDGIAVEIDSNTVKQAIMNEEQESCRPRRHSYRADKEWRSEITGNDYHIN
jgi:hypothetical protein